jgi:hypothetical protein
MRLRASCAELLFARAALGVFPTRACPGHGQRGDVLARPARPTRSATMHGGHTKTSEASLAAVHYAVCLWYLHAVIRAVRYCCACPFWRPLLF